MTPVWAAELRAEPCKACDSSGIEHVSGTKALNVVCLKSTRWDILWQRSEVCIDLV